MDPIPLGDLMPLTGEQRYCTATTRQGKPCRQPAIRGASVCKMHGGNAPQVRKAAALRLAMLIDPAIGVILGNLKDRKKNPSVAQRAAEDVLDRNELLSATKIYIGGDPDAPVHVKFDVDNLTDEQLELALKFARTIRVDREGPGSGDSSPGSGEG